MVKKVITLGECNQRVNIGFWQMADLAARQHVAKHLLNPREGWQSLVTVGVKLAKLSKRLDTLSCKREEHRDGRCRAFRECDALLRKLVPDYLRAAEAAIDEGARIPRHTHNHPRTVGRGIEETCWFLSQTGVLAETFQSFDLRTAYRHNPNGTPLTTDEEYLLAAKELVRITNKKKVKEWHSESNWYPNLGSTAIKDALAQAMRRSQESKR